MSKKPLDEILNLGAEQDSDADDEFDEEEQGSEPRTLAQVIPIKPDMQPAASAVEPHTDEAGPDADTVSGADGNGPVVDEFGEDEASETFILEDEDALQEDLAEQDAEDGGEDQHQDDDLPADNASIDKSDNN